MKRPVIFWRRRSGVTLIEVLVALALLGSLAVAMVLSRGRLRDQYDLAEKKMQAVQVADAMLAQWWAGDLKHVPAGLSGHIEGYPGWGWETQPITSRELMSFGAHVVRLRIFDESTLGDPVELTSVDVVVPQMIADPPGSVGEGGP